MPVNFFYNRDANNDVMVADKDVLRRFNLAFICEGMVKLKQRWSKCVPDTGQFLEYFQLDMPDLVII